jgi:type II secretory pathway predicted ATPase ExeA
VWKRYWKLSVDPFSEARPTYVAAAPHEEAVARLADAIETGQRRAVIRAGAGLGKSMVLARALAETRSPAQRAVLRSSPADSAGLLAALAEGLGRRVPPGSGRAGAWKALETAVRICRWQNLRVVLAIDDCQHLGGHADRADLDRLVHLDPHPGTRLTVLQSYRTGEPEGAEIPAAPWDLAIRLPALTRGDTARYLRVKLAAAGRIEPAFTPRAIDRLHAASAGNPRGLDRLASLALRAGALGGLEMITPDVIAGVARECTTEAPELVT